MLVRVELLQQRDLSQRGRTHPVVGEGNPHLLDGHVASSEIVEGTINSAIGACERVKQVMIRNRSPTHNHTHTRTQGGGERELLNCNLGLRK